MQLRHRRRPAVLLIIAVLATAFAIAPTVLVAGPAAAATELEISEIQDSGLIDVDSWTEWIKDTSPIEPSYARRASTVSPMPSELTAGETTTLAVGDPERATGGPNNTSTCPVPLHRRTRR